MAQRRTAPNGARSNDQLRRPESSAQDTSEELQSFYEDIQRTDLLERKLSARKSVATSVWSPSPPKPATPPAHASSSNVARTPSKSDINVADNSYEAASERDRTNRVSGHQLGSSRSITSDMKENATWAEKGKWADTPAHSFRVKYPLHNPNGPRWYRNHHLIPPSEKKPSMRPPTFFSPSFPPIHTSSSPANILGSAEGLDGTPSESPLPTPTSSQTRVAEGGKRSRKTSQTTPDNIDLLDVTDPWGQSWHHRSPYDFDFGSSPAATAPDGHNLPVRPRRASTTAVPNKFQTVTPSPLSQSTSAVHLPGSMPQIHVPRKLSKRRTPTAEAVFGSQPPPKGEHRKAASVPHTPIETAHVISSRDHIPTESAVLPIRMSVAPPPAQSAMFQTPKKEKRGSMLNRLARKFSLLRKPQDEPPTLAGSEYWHRVESDEIQGYINGHGNASNRRSASPNKSTRESVKRVPPPSEDPPEPPAPPPPPPAAEQTAEADRVSLTSLDTPFSMGRLTIANPDLPDSEKEPVPLADPPMSPIAVPEEPAEEEEEPIEIVSSPLSESDHLSPNDAWSRFEKPLPLPQLATPKFSELGLSVPEQSTPEVAEETLPPPLPEKPPLNRAGTSATSISGPQGDLKRSDPRSDALLRLPVQEAAPEPETPDDQDQMDAPLEPLPSPAPETPKRSVSQARLGFSTKDLPASPETTPDRSQTQSPPMPQSWAQYETPERTAQVLPSASVTRKKTVSPEPPIVIKPVVEPAANTQASSGVSPEPAAPEPPLAIRRASAKATHTISRTKTAPKAAPAPVAVPVPGSSPPALPVPAANGSKAFTQLIYEASPLSTSSILANPPTPYDYRQSITLTPDQSAPPSLPPKSIYEGKASHNPSPLRTSAVNPTQSNPSPSRQTETFKLVRSSSGNVYASGQTIHAQGEQWEVVESTDTSKPRKDKSSSSKNKESEHRHREHDRKSARYSSKEQEYKSRDRDRDQDYRPREHERRSKDYEYRSREADQKEHDRKAREREYEYRSREQEQQHRSSKDAERKSEYYKTKDYDRSRDRERPRDYEKPSRDYDRSREYDAPRARDSRSKDYDVVRESERTRDRDREHERVRESERAREHERRREAERQREAEIQREAERQREADRQREAERQREKEAERQREAERQKELERLKEAEILREAERQREMERQRDVERQKEVERQREREAERQREREAARREKEAERQREREAERQREREVERQRELERSHKAKEAERRHSEKEHRSRRDRESKRNTQTIIEVIPSTDYYMSSAYRMSKPAAPDPYHNPDETAKVKSTSKTRSRRADEPSKSSRTEHRSRKQEQKPVEAIPFPTSNHAPRPHVAPVQPPKEPAPSLRLERIPSLTARPTSELPSAAEMNAIRAKESWDMERLWKARSMYGLEPNAPTSNFIHDAGSSSSKSDEAHTQSAVYGSSHTAYVVSSPFSSSGRGSQIYHSMPTAPPPIIYSSPASIPSIPDLNSSYDPQEHPPYRPYNTQGSYQTSPMDFRASTSMPRPPLSNPLPEPPREFPLDLKSTAKSSNKSNNRQSNDYWTKYNGITAIH